MNSYQTDCNWIYNKLRSYQDLLGPGHHLDGTLSSSVVHYSAPGDLSAKIPASRLELYELSMNL